MNVKLSMVDSSGDDSRLNNDRDNTDNRRNGASVPMETRLAGFLEVFDTVEEVLVTVDIEIVIILVLNTCIMRPTTIIQPVAWLLPRTPTVQQSTVLTISEQRRHCTVLRLTSPAAFSRLQHHSKLEIAYTHSNIHNSD